MKKLWLVLCTILLLFSSIGLADATLVASASFSSSGGFAPFDPDLSVYSSANVWLFFDDPNTGGGFGPADVELGPVTINTGSIPAQFAWTSADSGFAEAVGLVTNGSDDMIGVRYEFLTGDAGGSDGDWESNKFSSSPGFSDPDLRGSVIDSITLRVTQFDNSVRDDVPGTTQDILWTDFAAVVTFEGTPVPEPTTMLLLGTGLVGLAGFRKKFKN